MRYTTQRFGETVYLLGEFTSARNLGEVTIALYDLSDPTSPITLDDANCEEITLSQTSPGNPSSFSTYSWPSSNVTSPSLTAVQYLYIMTDTITGRVQKGKFTVGGFPDASAVGLYDQEVHITPMGVALDPIGTMGANGTLTFTSGGSTGTINRTVGSWTADLFALGDYVEITGSNLNNGVFGPISAVTATDLTLDNSDQLSIVNDTDAGTEVIISKAFQFDIGTRENPVNNLYDANLIAKALDINAYHIRSGMTFTVDFNHANWVMHGDDPAADIVTFDGHDTTGITFETLGMRGDFNGRIGATRCIIGDLFTTTNDIQGTFNDCGFSGLIVIAAGGTVTGLGVAATTLSGAIVSFVQGSSPSWLVGSMYGLWSVRSMVNAGAVFGIACLGAVISLESTCTFGTVQVGGIGEMNISALIPATLTITDQLVRGTRLDENVSDIVAFVS